MTLLKRTRITALSLTSVLAGALWSVDSNARVVDVGALDNSPKYSVDLTTKAEDGPDNASGSVRPVVPWAVSRLNGADWVRRIDIPLQPQRTPRSLYLQAFAIATTRKAETWLVSLSVMGLIVIQLRRTQKLLVHHPA